jgi:glutaminase
MHDIFTINSLYIPRRTKQRTDAFEEALCDFENQVPWRSHCPNYILPNSKTDDALQQLVEEAHSRVKNDNSGKNADYIPYLASVPPNLCAVAIETVTGHSYAAGDVDFAFSIQSVSKPFTAGFYDESGFWSWDTGLPAKSGVGGGVLAVVPGRMAIVGFGPPLNDSGNSVRGAAAIRYLAHRLNLSLFCDGRYPICTEYP